MTAAHQEADEIVLGTDGAYWWVYELKLLKKTSILFVVWKILGGAFVGIWMFVVFLSAGDEGFWWGGFSVPCHGVRPADTGYARAELYRVFALRRRYG